MFGIERKKNYVPGAGTRIGSEISWVGAAITGEYNHLRTKRTKKTLFTIVRGQFPDHL